MRRFRHHGRAQSFWARENITKILFVVPAGLYMVLFFGYPVVKNLIMSFQDYTTKTFFTGEAPWVGLQNYVTVVSSNLFAPALLNTALFTIGSIAGQFVIGLRWPASSTATSRSAVSCGPCCCCPGCCR